ncbi:AAA family ATPase [Actinomadura graeca]|uniref:AAA family ATPase n=1 Tax=Actinomadura graeca TaxID=2750812 RepID=A0ABX8QX24_9ACTN|nr:AAA family ATPase [Actinomadura graeca]QXJ23315.1 AAA family ATPase [Actinomadura graeca]
MTEAIAERFSTVVGLHVIANLRPDVQPGTPLLLGIQGPAGEGKTYQVERILENAGIHSVLLSGGELESPNAGAPAARMREAYAEAGAYADAGTPAAVLLNDADAAIGSWGDMTQYTVNTQNLITELMHLADYPTRVEGRAVRRVPIILTGNDFTRLYAPMRRDGRMRIFSWRMRPEERASAVRALYPWLTPGQAEDLVGRYPGQPIAFWAAARRRMDDSALTTALYRHGLHDLARALISHSRVQIDDRPRPIEDILLVAESMAADTAHDFLSS